MQTLYNYYPILIVGAILGTLSVLLVLAFVLMKNKKEAFGFERTMPDREILKRLLVYAKPYRMRFVAIGLLVCFSVAYDIVSPWLIGRVQEMIKTDFEMTPLLIMVFTYVGILIVSMLSSYVQAILLQKTGQRIVSEVREDLFTHIETLSHETHHHTFVGTLVTRVANDTNSISMMFTHLLVNLIKNIVMILAILGAMLCLNYALTLLVLCFVPFILLFTIIFRKFLRRAFRHVRDATTEINAFLAENLSGMKIIQVFGREDIKDRAFSERNQKLNRAKNERLFTMSLFRPLIYMLFVMSVLCLFYFGGKGYLDGSFLGIPITSGVIVSFYLYVSKFFTPIQSIAEQFNVMQAAFAGAEKIFTVLDIEPTVKDGEDAFDMPEIKGEIEFKNVWFAYKDEEWVLKDVSFHIAPGETVALCGATGSGKTTILSLLTRNYDIQKGEILVDGVNIRKIKLSSLRRHFGCMLQDVFLFAGSVRSNITLRAGECEESEKPLLKYEADRTGFSEEEIMDACRYVNADRLIARLPHGLDEEVRERGNNFSAGERQLLSFARTVVHKPSVMILDEATANIDTETELLIQNSLEKMMNIGTMIMVAHRLSTIQHADCIYVLSHGEIIERGNHEELLSLRGAYYGLYELQYKKEAIKNK